MSQEVDERVVEMRFDNAQFEKNVHQTMQSLEKLNDSLQLDGAERALKRSAMHRPKWTLTRCRARWTT